MSNKILAKTLTSSVLHTQVGPTKINDIGLILDESWTLLLLTAKATSLIAFDWPMIFFESSFSKFCNFLVSFCSIFVAGIPVHNSITLAKSEFKT